MLDWLRGPPRTAAPADDALFAAQKRFFEPGAALTVVDAGAHRGETALQYLVSFPRCKVIALEPEPRNRAAAAAALAKYGERVELLSVGLADRAGKTVLRLTSHSGAHSLLEVGDMRYYDSPVDVLPPIEVEMTTLDGLCADRSMQSVDILKMDIQGAELMALKGARDLLTRSAISFVVLEVSFQALYKEQPTFWDLADHLRDYGYALQGLYEHQHHAANHAVLRWADAIFAAPSMVRLPE